MGQTPTPTKPTTTSEPAQETAEGEDEPVGELELVPTPKESGIPQSTALDNMAEAARQILAENPDIAEWMLEHLRTQPLVPLRPEDLVTLAKPIEVQPRAAKTQSQDPMVASPSNLSTPSKLRKSPTGKVMLTPRRGVGFSLGIAHETSSVKIRWEGTSSEPIQVEDQPARLGAELESGPGQEDPATPFPIGAKTRPITRSASKQGPSTKTPTSMKRPTKTLGKGSSSKRPKK